MADWVTVAILVFLGIALVLAEIIFVPGTTFVGILGFISGIIGIYLGFTYFGAVTGWWILGGTALAFILSLYFGFRGDTWDRFSLKDTSLGKFNEGYSSKLQVAERGKTLSALRPIGKAEFNDKTYEVRSYGNYIDSNTEVEIVKIDGNNIYVEPLK
ncbi:MAG: NfeD family protein [Fulvivirga sp.]|nr:NfeD family protein [Fulvivirga sp.]